MALKQRSWCRITSNCARYLLHLALTNFAAKLEASLKQLVNLFLVNGFALGGSVERVETNDGKGAQFRFVLNAPATLWGGRALQQQSARLSNDFLLKTAKEFVQRSGYLVLSSSVKYNGSTEESTLSIR